MKDYRFEQIKPNIKNLDKGFKKFLVENDITPEWIKSSCTRYEYDDSDYTAWHLFYGENKEQMGKDREILSSVIFKDKQVFNVSGNGWGTGLSVMLNLSSNHDK